MKRAMVSVLAIFSLAIVAISGCSSAAPSMRESTSGGGATAPAPSSGQKAVAPSAPGQAPQDSAGSANNAERMVIRNVSLKLIVADVDDVLSRVSKLTQEAGGFVVSSSSQERNGDRVGQATLRVPADRLDDAVKRIRGMAARVTNETTNAKDVTEEFVDQDARLKTLRATESQYLQLMQSARTIDDVMKVQQVLQQTRQQIEQTQGRMQYLQRSAELATVTLELSTATAAKPLSGGAWSVQEVADEAVRSLLSMGTVLATLAIWVGIFSPLWVPTWLLIRWWRRRLARRRAAVVATRTPPAPPAPQTA